MKKTRTVLITLLALFWLGLAAWAWVRTPDASSNWERRKLAQMPKITTNNLLSGTFMSDFESYTQDQFPLRNGFRRLKSEFHYFVLRELDNNGIALAKQYASQGKLCIVAPDDTCGVRTLSRDPDALSRLYEKGLRDGEKIPAFLD